MPTMNYTRNTNPFFKVLQDVKTITIVDRGDDLRSMLNNFTKVGLSYKGSSQYCYRADGESSKLAVSIDPLRAKTGFFSSQITSAMEASVEKKSFMIIQRGVSLSGSEKPVSLNSLVGSRWSGTCEASIFLGIALKPDILSISSPVINNASNEEDSALSELISMSVLPSISAGGTLSGSASCDVFYAEDKYPLYFEVSESEAIRGEIEKLLELGTLKSLVKKEAVDFINKYNLRSGIRFMQKNYLYERRTPISNIKRELTELRDRVDFGLSTSESKNKRKQLERHIYLLDIWDTGANLPVVPTFLRVTAYSATSSGNLSVDVSLMKQKIGLSAECSGSYIPTTTTFQSVYPLKQNDDGFICNTQTTNINYQTISYSSIGQAKTIIGKKSIDLIKTTTVMTISYVCSTIIWKHIPGRNRTNSARQPPTGVHLIDPALMEPGSGYSVGKTFEIDNLLLFYKKDENGNLIPPGIDPYQDMSEQASRSAQVYSALNDERTLPSKFLQKLGIKSKNSLPALKVIDEMIEKNAGREDLRSVFEWLLGISAKKPQLPENITSELNNQLSINSGFRPVIQRYYEKFIKAEQESQNNYDPAAYTSTEDAYLRTVASSLRISYEQLREFFLSPGVFDTLRDLKSPQELTSHTKGHAASSGGIKNIILEATFRPNSLINVELIQRKSPTRTTVEISDRYMQSTINSFISRPAEYNLESIAIRYHLQEKTDDGRSFSPGISVLGTGAGICLKKIEESGSAAVIEIFRLWFHPDLVNIAKHNPAGTYESAVPPVALFLR